jgi:hypothetical protein
MSRVSLIIGGVTADLYKGEDITLVKQAKDLTDLGATRTDFSRPFTIPATDTNNGIFEHFYNLDIDDPTTRQRHRSTSRACRYSRACSS